MEALRNHPHVPAPPPLNDIRKEIQERLDLLEIKEREIPRERLRLYSRWNCSLAITQLPDEILFHIFMCFSEQSKMASGFGLANTGWTKLMLVCRRWCDVARATPQLWRTIDVGKTSSWMALALFHSGDATIDISFLFDFTEEHASLLQPHHHRLRAFRVRVWSPHVLRVIRNTLPVLEILEIHSTPGEERALKRFHADLRITREQFPNLLALRIAHTIIPRDPLFYARLYKLSLKGCPFKSSHEQFVQLLSDCPELEHLELDNFLHQLSDGKNVGPPRTLPSLVSVRLDDHVPVHSMRFLSRIVTPSASLSVTAKVGSDEATPGDTATLRAIVPPSLTSSLPRLPTVRWGRLIVTGEQCSILCHPTKPRRDETPLVELSLKCPLQLNWEYCLSDGLTDLLALFGFAPLTHMEVERYFSIVDAEAWARFFRAFPSLVSLEADAEEALYAGLYEASLSSPADDATEPMACRGLERLSLGDSWGLWRDTPVHLLLDPLIHCLRYRADRGVRLKELHMDSRVQKDVLEEYLPLLKEVVSNVVLKTT